MGVIPIYGLLVLLDHNRNNTRVSKWDLSLLRNRWIALSSALRERRFVMVHRGAITIVTGDGYSQKMTFSAAAQTYIIDIKSSSKKALDYESKGI